MTREEEAALDRADMARLAAGQHTGLDALMERHAGRLQAYLLRLLQNTSDAQDLAQETFVRVFEHRHRFDPRQDFLPWLYTIATNRVRDRFRWRARHPESPLDEGPSPTGPQRTHLLPSPQPVPSEVAQSEERAEAVRAAVLDLDESLRLPLVLSEFEDRSHEEIALILKCSAKAVEMKLYRARAELRTRLRRWLSPPGG